MRLSLLRCILVSSALLTTGAEAAADSAAFFQTHCLDCHDADSRKGGVDLSATSRELNRPETFPLWTKVHDVLVHGEMPPPKRDRPPHDELLSTVHALRAELVRVDSQRIAETGRIRMRRMTRSEYENTLKDLLSLERLEVQGLLPPDGSVSGFKKNAGALDISPAHLQAYSAAAEKALRAAISTRSTPPPVFRRRIYPAGLFKFKGNLSQGNFVLLKDQLPDPALPARGGFEHIKGYINDPTAEADMPERKRLFEQNSIATSQSAVGLLMPNQAGYEAALNIAPVYAGTYRIRLSTWGFHWNKGRVEPALESQAAVLRAHEEGKQQEGGRLLHSFTAESLSPAVHAFDTWLESHESLVFDPVSIPWRGLRVSQVGGRSAEYVSHGVALDWFEIEGPLFSSWPPESHKRLFGELPVGPLAAGAGVFAPERETINHTPGYLPAMSNFDPAEKNRPLETVQSADPERDARSLLGAFVPRAYRRPVIAEEIAPYVSLAMHRIAAGECFEDAMRRAYVAVLTSPEMLFLPGTPPANASPESTTSPGAAPAVPNSRAFARATRLAYWLWNSPPDDALLAAARDGTLLTPAVWKAQVQRLLKDARGDRFIRDFADQWLEMDRLSETTPDKHLYPEYSFLLHEGMAAETYAFLKALIDGDLPIRTLVHANFSMLTQRLAHHYGIGGVTPFTPPIP